MTEIEDICEPEWAAWYRMSPQERWAESQKLWQTYLALGGSLDPEPDTQSPFFDADEPRQLPFDGRTGMRVVRRSGVQRDADLGMLKEEEQREREADRLYWEPLRKRLAALRKEERKSS